MNHTSIPSRILTVYRTTGSDNHTASLPQPISFHFQVVEYIDETGKVIKSRLEVKRNIHDDYGNIQYSDPWFEVPRIQRPI